MDGSGHDEPESSSSRRRERLLALRSAANASPATAPPPALVPLPSLLPDPDLAGDPDQSAARQPHRFDYYTNPAAASSSSFYSGSGGGGGGGNPHKRKSPPAPLPQPYGNGRGRPNLTWGESVKRDLKEWNISKELAMDRSAWRLAINGMVATILHRTNIIWVHHQLTPHPRCHKMHQGAVQGEILCNTKIEYQDIKELLSPYLGDLILVQLVEVLIRIHPALGSGTLILAEGAAQ